LSILRNTFVKIVGRGKPQDFEFGHFDAETTRRRYLIAELQSSTGYFASGSIVATYRQMGAPIY
jgi:hypothetical protein